MTGKELQIMYQDNSNNRKVKYLESYRNIIGSLKITNEKDTTIIIIF